MDTRNDPIAFSDEDRLGRAPTAKVFARALMANPSRAMTVAVYGPWGSGKTSFANLIQAELRSAGLFCAWFNPWQFTNSEALTLAFFDLLAHVLGKSNPRTAQKVREDFHRYSSSITSLSLSSEGGTLLNRRPNFLSEPNLEEQKDILFEHFRSHGKPIIIFVDDIDRLADRDIRLTIQLVKSNADFPNLKFVLLFQKETVEAALKTEGQSGADFLEKIIEVPIELPLIRSSAYVDDFLKEVADIFQEQSELGPVDSERWQRLIRSGILDPFRTLRRKNRLLDRLQLHAWNVQSGDGLDINLVDLLAIEILRSVDYDLYSRVRHYELGLTEVGEEYRAQEERRTSLTFLDKMLIEAGPGEHDLGRMVLSELFPQLTDDPLVSGEQQERDFRISRSRHFSKYFLEGLQLGEMGTSNRKQLEEAALHRGEIGSILVDYKNRGMLFDALDHLRAIADQVPPANHVSIAVNLGKIADSYGTSRARGFGRSLVNDSAQVIKQMTLNSTAEARSEVLKALSSTGSCLQVSVLLSGDKAWLNNDGDLAPNLTRLARTIQAASEDGRLEKMEMYGILLERWRHLNESRATAFVRQIATDPIRFTEFARAIAPCVTTEAGVMLLSRTTHAATASGVLRFLSKRTAVKAANHAIKSNKRPKDAAFLQSLLDALRYSETRGQDEDGVLFEEETLSTTG